MTPTLPRRSFLGWTAALAGCALLTRPALAVPPVALDWTSESEMLPTWPLSPFVIITDVDGGETRMPMRRHGDGWISTAAISSAGRITSIEMVQPAPVSVKPIWVHLPGSMFRSR